MFRCYGQQTLNWIKERQKRCPLRCLSPKFWFIPNNVNLRYSKRLERKPGYFAKLYLLVKVKGRERFASLYKVEYIFSIFACLNSFLFVIRLGVGLWQMFKEKNVRIEKNKHTKPNKCNGSTRKHYSGFDPIEIAQKSKILCPL